MNRYAPSRPRALLAMIATALAVLNFAVLVALPATIEASADQVTVANGEEPHVDTGVQAAERARAARGRRHELIARAVGSGARASDRLWATMPD